MIFNLKIYQIVYYFYIILQHTEDVSAQNINEMERFSKTRFLPLSNKAQPKQLTHFFKWDFHENLPKVLNNITTKIDEPLRLNIKINALESNKTAKGLKKKRRKRKKKQRFLNENEITSTEGTNQMVKQKKQKLIKRTKKIKNNNNEIFSWNLNNTTKLTISNNKKKKRVNGSLKQLNTTLDSTSKYNNNKNLLIKTSTNRINARIPSEDLVQITKLNKSSSVIFKGEDKNKRLFSDVTTKFKNTLSLPKINYDKNVENLSVALLLNNLGISEEQLNTILPPLKNKFDGRKDSLKSRKIKSRCSLNRGGCDHFCHDKGATMCSCLEGFSLDNDGKSCTDVNECLTNNGGCQHSCYNTPGSYYCDCSKGLRISTNLHTCEDINECLLRNGHGPCQDTCRNIYGSYVCSCVGLKGTRLSADKHTCKDINECLLNNSGCSHGCVNTLGRSFCTCPNGMQLGPDWKTCQDINECEDDEIAVKCKSNCKNTIGSYFCEDVRHEMQNDQLVNNLNIACPPIYPPKHGYLTCNREKAQPFLRSFAGRIRITNKPGTFCELVCPIGLKIVGDFKIICSQSGSWEGEQNGKCEPLLGRNYDPRYNYIHVKWALPRPKITCPESKLIHLGKEEDRALIKLYPPKTNVDWKYVQAYPHWIKQLRADLLPGRHSFTFVATNPATLISDSCSFHIIIKKPSYI